MFESLPEKQDNSYDQPADINPDDQRALLTEIRILIPAITKLVSRDHEQRLAKRGINLSGLQLGVLRVLHSCVAQSDEGTSLSDLSQKMMLTSATLVPVIDALERQKLAKRQRDPRDRRRTLLSLTEEGTRLVESLHTDLLNDSLTTSLAQLSPDKCRLLRDLLWEVVEHMTDGAEHVERIAFAVRVHRTLREQLMNAAETTAIDDLAAQNRARQTETND